MFIYKLPAYELCKYLTNILKNLTKESKYNVKDSVEFKSRINNMKIENDELLVSFDVISLFPSIPVNFALKIIKENWDILQESTDIPQELFLELVTFCVKDTRYFKYDDKVFEQRKGLAMGSPASPVVADIIMEKLLNHAIDKMETKPKVITKYVDDVFAVIKKDLVDDFLKILNSFNKQIQFTVEKEANDKLPYLDSVVIRHGNHLKIDWYQKPTASGRLINFYSKHPRNMKINTATNFIKRVLNISDDMYHSKNINIIRNILAMNDFPINTIENLIQSSTENKEINVPTVQPKIYKSMTYIPGLSERLKNSNIIDKEKYVMALRTDNCLKKLFSNTKSKIDKGDKSNLIYEIECGGDGSNVCKKVYVGTTKTKLKTRLSSHKSDQKAINKPLEQKTALAAHCTVTGHKPRFDNVKILAQEKNYMRRYCLETLFINSVPGEKRLNFKSDTDHCAKIYRQIINKKKKK